MRLCQSSSPRLPRTSAPIFLSVARLYACLSVNLVLHAWPARLQRAGLPAGEPGAAPALRAVGAARRGRATHSRHGDRSAGRAPGAAQEGPRPSGAAQGGACSPFQSVRLFICPLHHALVHPSVRLSVWCLSACPCQANDGCSPPPSWAVHPLVVVSVYSPCAALPPLPPSTAGHKGVRYVP
jgi:hypothetical protein